MIMNHLIVFLSLTLFGCTSLYSTFDNVEYNHFVSASYIAKQSLPYCQNVEQTKANTLLLRQQMDLIKIYVTHLNENNQTLEALAILDKMVDQMVEAYNNTTPSETYCIAKLNIISQSIQEILKTIGNRPK